MRMRWEMLLVSVVFAAATAADERTFEYCTVCHGANGNGNPAIHAPRIAGLEPWYLKNQFNAFRSGWRGVSPDDAPGNEMRPVAEALSTAEIDQAIAYVGSFAARPAPLTLSGDVSHGKSLYAPCAACHGAHAEGKQALRAPALTGRTDWYLAAQLHNYRGGLRGNSKADASGQQMRAVAMSLSSDGDINDVVAYINTLR